MYSHINPNQSTNLSRDAIPTRLQSYDKNHQSIKTNEVQIKPILKSNNSDEEKETKPQNNVIVLADNKNYSRDFLKCLGMSSGSPYLCTRHIPTKMFTFQIYGLEEPDEKILSHVKTNAGLVIIVSMDNYSKLINRINLYTSNISHIPILIVIEGIKDLNQINQISKTNVRYELSSQIHSSNYIQSGIGFNNLSWFNEHVIKFKPLPKDLLGLEELVRQFVDCELSIENWNHFNRLRLVYFSLKNFGYDKSIDQTGWLCKSWNKYKNTIGHSHLWNYTLTKFWIDQIFSLMLKNPQMDFAQLYSEYSYLSDGNLHKKYYSNDVLFSDKARNEWIPPNIQNI